MKLNTIRLLIAGIAAVASLVSAVTQALRAPAAKSTGGAALRSAPVVGEVTRAVQDALGGYRLAGFSDAEAKSMVRTAMRSQIPGRDVTRARTDAASVAATTARTTPDAEEKKPADGVSPLGTTVQRAGHSPYGDGPFGPYRP